MISFGASQITSLYFGNHKIVKRYLGNDLIYSSQPQLATPTNLSVTDTTASFDEVENAESYEFFVDDVSIGEYTPQSGYTGVIEVPPHLCCVKVNGTATSSNYDYATNGEMLQITVNIGDYFTVYCEDEYCWLNTTYSSGVTGSPTSQTTATFVTITPTSDNFHASISDTW